MDGDEQVAAGLVGELRAVLEPDVVIVLAGEDDLQAALLELLGELLGDGQGDVLLARALLADGARVVAAVAGDR